MAFNSSHCDSFPPSPADDRGSKWPSWGNLVQKLIELKRQADTDQNSSMSDSGSVTDMSMTDSESSFFYDPEETLCAQVVETIAQSLTDASDYVLKCSKLVLPGPLLTNIGQELLHLAASEPCGLKGALIDLCLEQGDQGGLCRVEQIAVDPELVPTFHLTLVLRPEVEGLWPKVQRLFRGGKYPQTQNVTERHAHTLKLSMGFTAIKRKLYSSGELLVEEC